MESFNETFLHCHISRTQLFYADLLQALVVAKATYDVEADGRARPAVVQQKVLEQDTETPFGTLDVETIPQKAWCDVALLGAACAPGEEMSVRQMDVSLRIGGAFSRTVRVTGDRVWVRAAGAIFPSDPVPFRRIPLTYERAFGGETKEATSQIGALPVPYFDNPHGCGYVAHKDQVAGARLPNVEEVDQLIETWTDRPMPAGVAPLSRRSAIRAQRGMEVDTAALSCRMDWSAFCFSHPRMSLPSYPAGARVTVDGVSSRGRWSFELPALDLAVRVELGAHRYQLALVPDTLYLWPDDRQVTVVARRAFIYHFRPERRRALRVMATVGTTSARPWTTIRALRASPAPEVPLVIPRAKELPLPLEEIMASHPMTALLEDLPLLPSG